VYCWECFAPFGGAPVRPATPASPRPLGAAPTVVRPAPAPAQAVYRGPRTSQHARRFESAQPKRGITVQRIVGTVGRLLTIGVLVAGGFFGYRWANTFLGSGFPSEIGGIPKTLAGGEQLKATIATWRSEVNVQARSQIYSSAIQNNQDAFAVLRVTAPADGPTPVELLRRLASQGSTIKIPASRVHDEQVEGVNYACVTGVDQATECLWHGVGGEVVIVMGGPSRDYGATLTLTVTTHDAL
jgi:hypothetical protein